VGGVVLGKSKLCILFWIEGVELLMGLRFSLALVEMKMLLREVYSRYRTTVADDMTASMELDDQIISSRPKGQSCKLVFTAVE
jgi:hypothetical protein